MKLKCLTILFFFNIANPAQAALALIDNFSFEDDPAPFGSFPTNLSSPSSWDSYDPFNILPLPGNTRGVVHPNEDFFFINNGDGAHGSEVPIGARVPHGVNGAITWLTRSSGSPAGLSQTLTETLQQDTIYTLSVGVGNIGSGTGSGTYASAGYFDLEGFPGYSVELWAGNTRLTHDSNTLAIPEREWRTSTIQYTSGTSITSGQNLEIRLINLNISDPTGPGIEVDFDNVILDISPVTPVPEPSSLLLTALGVISLTLRKRRKADDHSSSSSFMPR